jgi:outer membrane receptor protein involved in Fe transport
MRSLTRSFMLSLLLVPCVALAQTVDTSITGTVVDTTGAVIPGANVLVTATATETQKKAVTSSSGGYSVTYLTPGTYDIQVSANGFAAFHETGLVLEINQQAKVNVTLKPGGTAEVVQVTAEQPLLQSEDSSLGAVVSTEQAEQLPLNGRKFDDLAILTPGVTVSDPDNHTSSTAGSSINAFGSQVTWAQTNVDGVSMVNNRHAYVNIFPSVDAIQEFSVLTGNEPAQYGGGAGTVTNVQLKSGTNSLHGDVFEFIRNTAVDARNFFRPAPLAKQILKQNQFGGTLGGPIVKDKTFFFVSYEGLRSIQETPSLTNVLTPAQRTGDFSALLPGKQLKNPYTGANYGNNQIPVSPIAQNIVNMYMPLPNTNTNGNNYAGAAKGSQSNNQYIGRMDHRINERNQLAVHFIYQFRDFPYTAIDPNFTFTGKYPMYNAALQYVHTFSASLLNELRLGTDLEHVKQLSTRANTAFTAASVGINGFTINGAPLPPQNEGFPTLSISGFIGMGDGTAASNLDDSRTYQLVDNLTWTKGKHVLIVGADIRHVQDNATTDNTPYGSMSFTGSETGNAAADFILGVPANVITPEGVPLSMARQWRDFVYVQDNWKLTPNFTANLGLRYDLWVPPHNNLNTSRTLNFNTNPPTLVPLPDPLWKVSHKNFSPRVGIAYSLPRQFVVRAAYGITFYGGQFDNINILQLNPPIDPSFSLSNGTNPSNPPTATISNPVSAAITPASPNVASLPMDGKHPDLYLQTYNLTLSKQFWSNVIDISYVGVKGTHQDTSIPYFNNGPPQPANRTVNSDRPYPNFGNIRLIDFHGASDYNGLEVHFQHRFSHSLEFTTAYAFSHLLDNQGGDTNGSRSQTQIPTSKEWANGLTDQRHNLTIAMVWALPKLSGGNSVVRSVVNGWGINTIFQFLSGNPIFVSQSQDGENNGNLFERPDLVPGQPLTVAHRTIAQWFNTAAFVEAIGHYGSTPRNPSALVSPSVDPLTAALRRSFAVREQQHLDVRLEVFNALNTPQLSAPSGSQGSSAFGTITSTKINNREMQLGVKYIF